MVDAKNEIGETKTEKVLMPIMVLAFLLVVSLWVLVGVVSTWIVLTGNMTYKWVVDGLINWSLVAGMVMIGGMVTLAILEKRRTSNEVRNNHYRS